MRTAPYVALAIATLAALLSAAPVAAQPSAPAAHPSAPDVGQPWHHRISASAYFAAFDLSGRSDVYALLDAALSPGSSALGPIHSGGALRFELLPRWSLVVGADAGHRTVNSVSRHHPAVESEPVPQQTTLDLRTLPYVGAEWQLLQWKRAAPRAGDHLRLAIGGGAGVTDYRLRQRGGFVDADRDLTFENDFSSSGRGIVGYLSAGLEVPVRQWLAAQGELRRQFGSAPMTDDFGEFDRIDLGGMKIGAGIVLRPPGLRR